MTSTQAFNSNVLICFNRKYANVLDETDILGNEIALINDPGKRGYTLKKGKKVYFVESKHINKLPIKVKESSEIVEGTRVFHYVDNFSQLKEEPRNSMSFRKLIDTFCNFKHTNPLHFNLYKIMCIASYTGQINWRLATKVAFGKNSCVDVIRELTNNCARVDKATLPKLEYVLTFPFILANEVAALKKDDQKVFEDFATMVGDKSSKYTKTTRKGLGTKEIYDISRLSLCFTYNIADYSWRKGKKSFDEVMDEKVLNRFIPFRMEGWLDIQQFKKRGELDFEKEAERNYALYKNIIAKLEWIISHPLRAKYTLPEGITFGKGHRRWGSDFTSLCACISHYAKNKEEYKQYVIELYDCHKRYLESEIRVTEEEHPIYKEEQVK